jgi:hypothetical protein
MAHLAVLGIGIVEAAARVPLGALVAVRANPRGVLEDARQVQQVQVAKVVLRLVKSLSGPPEPSSR